MKNFIKKELQIVHKLCTMEQKHNYIIPGGYMMNAKLPKTRKYCKFRDLLEAHQQYRFIYNHYAIPST